MNVAAVVRGIASLSWLAVILVIAFAVLRAARGQPFRRAVAWVVTALVVAVLATTVSAGLVFVQPEERGVVISAVQPLGYRPAALQPGLRWIVPFAETVATYSIARQTYTMSIAPSEGQVTGDDSVAARTSDGQEVLIDASVIYSVDPNKIIDVHIQWKNRFETDLVRPQARGIIRDLASQFRVDEIYSERRGELTEDIREELSRKLADNGLILVDFVLRNIQFSPEYAASVEQKQIAEQLALQAAFVVQQRQQEAEQARQVAQGQADAAVIAAEGRAKARVIEATAEAQALQLIADALRNNPNLITFEYIQKLAPGIQVMLVPSDNPFLLPLPTLAEQAEAVVPTPEAAP
jgi:regulator of protease activity HflC (stomatin/prohibitin superfamily)